MPDYDNEDIVSQVGMWLPFTRPIFPPFTLPDITEGPLQCLTVNAQWMSYIIGACQVLARYETWKTDRETAKNLVQQAHQIAALVSDECVEPTCDWNWNINVTFNHSGEGSGWSIGPIPNCSTVGTITMDETETADLEFYGVTNDGTSSLAGGRFQMNCYAVDNALAVWTYFITLCDGSVLTDSTISPVLHFAWDGTPPLYKKSIRVICTDAFTFDGYVVEDYHCVDA